MDQSEKDKYIIELEAQIWLLQNDISDVMMISTAWTEITYIVSEMLGDNLAYIKKNGLTPTADKNKQRLLKIINQAELISKMMGQTFMIFLNNKNIHYENLKLKKELAQIKREENLANSL